MLFQLLLFTVLSLFLHYFVVWHVHCTEMNNLVCSRLVLWSVQHNICCLYVTGCHTCNQNSWKLTMSLNSIMHALWNKINNMHGLLKQLMHAVLSTSYYNLTHCVANFYCFIYTVIVYTNNSYLHCCYLLLLALLLCLPACSCKSLHYGVLV